MKVSLRLSKVLLKQVQETKNWTTNLEIKGYNDL